MSTAFDPLAVCRGMREAAERQDWDTLAAMEQAFATELRAFLELNPVTETDQEMLALLGEILSIYEILITLGDKASQHMARQLQDLNRGQQASHAYKGCG